MSEFANLPLDVITSSLTNPRKTFNAAKLAELAESIKATGVHQPVLVRPLPGTRVSDTERGVQYELVCGERRYRASEMAGVATIPAMVRSLTDDQVMEIQLVENLQRDDLAELEEAEGYEALMAHAHITADQVAAKIGKSRSYVFGRLKLLDLSQECKQALREGKIDSSRALLIARIPDSKLQLKALTHATTMGGYPADTPSVRELQHWLKDNVMLKLEHAIFSITDSRLVKDAGNCTNCPKRTGANPDIFSDVDSPDICTDPACFHGKEEAHRAQLRKKAESKGMRIVEGKEALELLGGRQYSRIPDDYHDLSGKRPDLGREGDNVKTLGELLGVDAPDPILFIHPRTQQMMELVPSSKAEAVLLTKGIASQEDDDADEASASADYAGQLESMQKRVTERSESLLHRGLFSACTDGVRALDDKASLRLLGSGELLRAIMLSKLDGYDFDEETLATALGYTFADGEDEQDGLAMHIRATTTANLCRALVICELQTDFHSSTNSEPLILSTLVKELALDTKAVTKEAKTSARAEFADRIKELQTKIDAQKANVATAPAARPKEGPGGSKGKGSASKTPPARAAKLSAKEATQGIADALQGIDGAASAPVGAVAQPAGPAGGEVPNVSADKPKIGAAVQITAERLNPRQQKFAGKKGTITGKVGVAWDVSFKGRTGGISSFTEDQITVVAA